MARKKTRGRPAPTPAATTPAASGRPRSAAAEPPAAGGAALHAGRLLLHALVAAGLVALTLLLYAGDLGLGFFSLDDATYVVDNPWIRPVTARNVTHLVTEPYFTMYAPTHLLSYMADAALGGFDARAFHLSSNVWAGLSAALVYLVALALGAEAWTALAAALLFAVHPAHVEAVAWISSRKDLVATLFALSSLAAHVRRRRARSGRGAWYALSLGTYVLAVAGKQSVVVVPVVLLAYDLLVHDPGGGLGRWMRAAAEKLPYALVTVAFALRTLGELPGTRTSPSLAGLARALLENLRLLAGLGEHVVFRTSIDAIGSGAARLAFVAGALVLLALAVGLVALPLLRRRAELALPAFLVAWTLLALSPSLAAAYGARGGAGIHPVTDRYLFFPSAAACILIATTATALARGIAGQVGRSGERAPAIAFACLAGLGALWTRSTLAYLAEWRDPRSVWFAAARKSEDPSVAFSLGAHFEDAADRLASASALPAELPALAEAIGPPGRGAQVADEWTGGRRGGALTEALRLELRRLAWEQFEAADARRGSRVLPNLYFRRGKMLLEDRRLDAARDEFERSLEQSQQHTWLDTRQSLAVRCHYALGLVDWQARDYASALGWLRLAEAEQRRFGGNWVPEVGESRARLERIVASGG